MKASWVEVERRRVEKYRFIDQLEPLIALATVSDALITLNI